ncbi:hypothetical protein ABWC92_000834 [Escherichia coli]|uniref:hypothetical protein n=1 Tax=Enterobacter sp. JMULE2 TaxID=2518340 RepID=UPI0015768976|nr:hypothetical protein [Enterobacter sp. JMULE2]NTZ40915.1 hypothetical protein [Enterobacter sp. JMULE2]
MSKIKTYRVVHEVEGPKHKIRIFGRVGEVINDTEPKEFILRDVSINESEIHKSQVLVGDFIERLKKQGFTEA